MYWITRTWLLIQLLKNNGFLREVKVLDATIGKHLKIVINDEGQNARITEVVRLSKPGRREYASAGEIPVVKHGRGMVIISTSKGLMTGQQAKKSGIGGELICKVY